MADELTTPGLLTETEEAIYRRYSPQIFAYLLRHVPSYQDAEDLLLEVFLVVLEKLPTLAKDELRLGGYIQVVARHKMADYYRKRGSFQQVSLEESVEMMYAVDETTPEQFALAQEKYARLRQAVSALPTLHQVILRLRYSHGLRVREIATHLAKSESSVRVTLSRALKRLRKLYPSMRKVISNAPRRKRLLAFARRFPGGAPNSPWFTRRSPADTRFTSDVCSGEKCLHRARLDTPGEPTRRNEEKRNRDRAARGAGLPKTSPVS